MSLKNKYQIYYYRVRLALAKLQSQKHSVKKLVVIILSSMAPMNLVLMSCVLKLRTTLHQFLFRVEERSLSLMKPTILILIQLNQRCVVQLRSFLQTVHSYSPVILKIVSLTQSTLVALSLILKSTVLNKQWLHSSLKELSGYLNKKVSHIRKMPLRQLLQNTFQTIVGFLMSCSVMPYLELSMLVLLPLLLMYNLDLWFQR